MRHTGDRLLPHHQVTESNTRQGETSVRPRSTDSTSELFNAVLDPATTLRIVPLATYCILLHIAILLACSRNERRKEDGMLPIIHAPLPWKRQTEALGNRGAERCPSWHE